MEEKNIPITREEKADFYKRFAKAKTEIGSIVKEKEGGKTKEDQKGHSKVKYKYADLPTILDGIKNHLFNNDIDIQQSLAEECILITSIIDLKTGYKENKVVMKIERATLYGGTSIQEFGSGMTYARRYSLQIAADIAPDDASDDDDGATAGNTKIIAKNSESIKFQYIKSEVESLRNAIKSLEKTNPELYNQATKPDAQSITLYTNGVDNTKYTQQLINMARQLQINPMEYIKTI